MSCNCRKFRNIIVGYRNLIKKSTDIEKIADLRLEICKLCTANKAGICIKCGCVIAAKVRVKEEKCKIGQW